MSTTQPPSMIALAIRRLRSARKMTQRELADKTGLNAGDLRAIESGRRKISSLEFALVAEALEVREEVLLGIEPLPARVTSTGR